MYFSCIENGIIFLKHSGLMARIGVTLKQNWLSSPGVTDLRPVHWRCWEHRAGRSVNCYFCLWSRPLPGAPWALRRRRQDSSAVPPSAPAWCVTGKAIGHLWSQLAVSQAVRKEEYRFLDWFLVQRWTLLRVCVCVILEQGLIMSSSGTRWCQLAHQLCLCLRNLGTFPNF